MVIQPLTTAISTREYEVGGLFNASMTGPEEDEPPQGTLEVGYQIGCGIDMSTSNGVVMSGSLGFTPGLGLGGLGCCRDNRYPDCSLAPQWVPRGGAEAGHHQRHPGHEEAVRGRGAVGADHRIPHQDRRLRRRVVHPLVRVLDQIDEVSDAIVGYYGVTKKV